ncbi:roadblock/LC7 domain-containing protein [Streptomyces sp. NPDC001009]
MIDNATPNPTEELGWLLREFVDQTAGATHAVLLSKEGLRVADSAVDKDWADELAAGISGLASLATNITGPTHEKLPPRQVVIERGDCLAFIRNAGRGRSSALPHLPASAPGHVDIVLVVIADPHADAGPIGFEMSRLVNRFAPHMELPLRADNGLDCR